MKKTISILLSIIMLVSSIPASVISVFADAIPETVTVTDVAELQSEHNYDNNTNKTWVYTKDGAAELNVTFSADCSLENGADYVYIYDGNNNQIKRYTGKQLASIEINIPGDTVKIKLVSDEDTNAYGFAVDSVVVMTSISIETMPNTTKHLVNQEIDYTGLTVRGNFDDGTTKIIENYQLSDVDNTTVGTKEVTISYNGVTTSFNVDIYEPVLKSLEVVTLPTVTDYYCGDTADLDLTGLELLATDEDGETFTVESGYQVSDFSTDSLGTQTITITYKNVSTSFDLKVLNSIKYSISGEFATVTGIANNSIKNLVIPDTVEGKPITSISDYAFIYNTTIENVTLPNSITTIGSYAFERCTNLKRINMPTSLKTIGDQAFYNCSALEMVTFPEGLKTIGANAFYPCTNFTGELVIPNSVTEIGEAAFRGAKISSLVTPFVGKNMTTTRDDCNIVLGYIFGYTCSGSSTDDSGVYQYYSSSYYHYFIPSTLTSVKITKQTEIPYHAFMNCKMLTSIEIPDDVVSIGVAAYYGCSNLTSIYIPDGVTKISRDTFNGCSNLTKINLSEDITTIDSYAFYGCKKLKRIKLPQNLTTIGDKAFSNCSVLETPVLPNGLYTIGNEAFYQCTNFTGELVIPDSVTEISKAAFEGVNISSLVTPFVGKNMMTTTNDGLKVLGYIFGYIQSSSETSGVNQYSINRYFIPSTLTSVKITKQTEIPNNAFKNCTMLTSVELPETATSIGEYSFYGCSNLAEINIPLSTKRIMHHAFYNCNTSKLKVYYLGSSSDYSRIPIEYDNTPLRNATKYYNSCLPKNHRFDETYSTTNPTCTAQGYKTHKCIICGTNVKYDYVDANGHNYSSTVIAPTCTAEGYTKYTCSVCRNTYNDDYTNSLGHNYNTTITKQPTCTAAGTKMYSCTRCSYSYTETILAIGHDYVSTIIAPTCTAQGYTKYTCSGCSNTYNDDYTNSLDHNYNTTITKQPTCTAAGTKMYSCTRCSYSYTETILAIGHDYVSTITRETTCSEEGIRTYTCTNCGLTKTSSVPATGKHTYDKGKVTKVPTSTSTGVMTYACKVCGTKKTASIAKLQKASISSLSAKSKGFMVKWKKISSATGYQVQYSISSKFSSAKTITISKNSTTSKTVSKLKAKKKYYVRIRTYRTINGKKYYSSWSKAKAVTTKK